MDKIQQSLLEQIAGIHEVPEGAYSLRINGQLHGKGVSTDKNGRSYEGYYENGVPVRGADAEDTAEDITEVTE